MNVKSLVFCVVFMVFAVYGTVSAEEITGTPGSPEATTTIDGRYLPPPPQTFGGEINLNADQSKPYWPARVVPSDFVYTANKFE